MDDVNVTLSEMVLNEVDDLLKKACITAKGQKTLIKQLATDRKDEVVNDCSEAVAFQIITSQSFLATLDGRKIARDLMIRFGFYRFWEAIRLFIKRHKPSRYHCQYIGNTFQMIWKKLLKSESNTENPEENAAQNRLNFEQEVLENLFRLAVVTERKWSDRFISIIEGLAFEKTNPIAHMLYRTSSHILWQSLEAPNSNCRFNGTAVFFRLFPLCAAPEDQLEFDLRQRQHEVIMQMLRDDCYMIRVEAIKEMLEQMSICWPVYKAHHRKEYITYIFDTLAKDECNEVRLAIYQSLPLLYSCGQAKCIVEHALTMIAEPGINETKDKLRLAAVKMLLALSETPCGIAFNSVIKITELVAALEIESNDVISSALVKLLVPYFCSARAADVEQRSKKFVELSRMSRVGAIRFHVKMAAMGLINTKNVVLHIRALIAYVKNKIRKADETLNETAVTAFNDTRSGVDFSLLKNLIDCCIVLYIASNKELSKDENQEQQVTIWKLFENVIKRLLDGHLKQTILAESAFFADSLLPPSMGEPAGSVLRRLTNLEFTDEYFVACVMQAGAKDFTELVKMIEDGLYAFAKELRIEKKLPRRLTELATSNSSDKSKNRYRKVVAFVKIILNYPAPRKLCITKYAFCAKKFHNIFEIFVNAMPSLIENEQEDLWIAIYEVYTSLTITVASQKAMKNPEFVGDDENDENVDSTKSVAVPDTFEKAFRWFMPRFNGGQLTSEFISNFITLATRHLECITLRDSSKDLVGQLGETLKAYAAEHFDGENEAIMRKKLVSMYKAGIEAIKFCKAEKQLDVVEEDAGEDEIIDEALMEIDEQPIEA